MKEMFPSLGDKKITEQQVFRCICSIIFAAYPLFVLTTPKGYRVVPALLFLFAVIAIVRGFWAWNKSAAYWIFGLALLIGPYYLGYIFGGVEGPDMERMSYGWLFVPIALAATCLRPSLSLFLGSLVLAALATLVGQLIVGGERPALYFNPIPYAEVAAAFFCVLCVTAGSTKKAIGFPWLVLGLVVWFGVILLTQTRGAMLAILPGIIYLTFRIKERFGKKSVVAGFVGFLFFSWMGTALTDGALSKRFELAVDEFREYRVNPQEYSSVAIRLELWRAAAMLSAEYPAGVGEEGAREVVLKWIDEGKVQWHTKYAVEHAHFHSDYFQALAVAGYSGLLGVLSFYILLLIWFYSHRQQVHAKVGMVVIFSYMLSGLTDVPLYNKLTLFSLFMIISFCLAGIHLEKTRVTVRK